MVNSDPKVRSSGRVQHDFCTVSLYLISGSEFSTGQGDVLLGCGAGCLVDTYRISRKYLLFLAPNSKCHQFACGYSRLNCCLHYFKFNAVQSRFSVSRILEIKFRPNSWFKFFLHLKWEGWFDFFSVYVGSVYYVIVIIIIMLLLCYFIFILL